MNDEEWDELIEGVSITLDLMEGAHIDTAYVEELVHQAGKYRNKAGVDLQLGGKPFAFEFLTDYDW